MDADFNLQTLLSALRDIEKIPVGSEISYGVCYEVFSRTRRMDMWRWVNKMFKVNREGTESTFPSPGIFTEQRLEFVKGLIKWVDNREKLNELHEWTLMRDELQRADVEDWEKEHGRPLESEIQWVLKNISTLRRILDEA